MVASADPCRGRACSVNMCLSATTPVWHLAAIPAAQLPLLAQLPLDQVQLAKVFAHLCATRVPSVMFQAGPRSHCRHQVSHSLHAQVFEATGTCADDRLARPLMALLKLLPRSWWRGLHAMSQQGPMPERTSLDELLHDPQVLSHAACCALMMMRLPFRLCPWSEQTCASQPHCPHPSWQPLLRQSPPCTPST